MTRVDFGLIAIASLLLIVGAFWTRGSVVRTDLAMPAPVEAMQAVSLGPTTSTLRFAGRLLHRNRSAPHFALDALFDGAARLSFSTSNPRHVVASLGRDLDVVGWAIDSSHGTAARAVVVLLDGRPITNCPVVGERPDVATAMASSSYLRSGFDCRLPANRLHRGNHKISLDIVTDLDSFDSVASALALEIESN